MPRDNFEGAELQCLMLAILRCDDYTIVRGLWGHIPQRCPHPKVGCQDRSVDYLENASRGHTLEEAEDAYWGWTFNHSSHINTTTSYVHGGPTTGGTSTTNSRDSCSTSTSSCLTGGTPSSYICVRDLGESLATWRGWLTSSIALSFRLRDWRVSWLPSFLLTPMSHWTFMYRVTRMRTRLSVWGWVIYSSMYMGFSYRKHLFVYISYYLSFICYSYFHCLHFPISWQKGGEISQITWIWISGEKMQCALI